MFENRGAFYFRRTPFKEETVFRVRIKLGEGGSRSLNSYGLGFDFLERIECQIEIDPSDGVRRHVRNCRLRKLGKEIFFSFIRVVQKKVGTSFVKFKMST
ncbi:hypothetical protein CDAR_61471 [Caerostris darwini]|uniref:PilZ domain-containing protein n=1 Tax=Caerostris darwini TaxID=1538125 RepID=A0AAV4UJ89_9ARAC|nr:hypothetical protein CDAR_61471 [Caerostris darwini]